MTRQKETKGQKKYMKRQKETKGQDDYVISYTWTNGELNPGPLPEDFRQSELAKGKSYH
jgi:hypothetical protein